MSPSNVKIEKLTALVHRRASEVIAHELQDPRLGFVTVSRVELSRDLRNATIYYSILGTDGDKSKTAHALESARGHIQSQVAAVMHTRTTPLLRFEYDQGVEGSVRISQILNELRKERMEDAIPPGTTEEE